MQKQYASKKNQTGYIALITVLIIASVVLVIGISTSLLSINDLQSAYAGRKNEEGLGLAESCVEDALLQLNKNSTIPSTITLPAGEGACQITINSQSGSNWDFTVTPQSQEYTKRVRVVASRGSSVTITSWLEQ